MSTGKKRGAEPDTKVTPVDAFVPDWTRKCEVCGNPPTVDCVVDGKVVHKTDLCGVCTWGEAECLDPDMW